MNRSIFLKSLFILAASPKVLAELDQKPKAVLSAGVFNDLRFVIPEAIPNLIAKYNEEHFTQLMEEIGAYEIHTVDYHHFYTKMPE